MGCNNTQHNNTKHIDIERNDTQHIGLICDTQHKRLSITTLSMKCNYAESCVLFFVMVSVTMLNIVLLNAECCCAECHCAECRGAIVWSKTM